MGFCFLGCSPRQAGWQGACGARPRCSRFASRSPFYYRPPLRSGGRLQPDRMLTLPVRLTTPGTKGCTGVSRYSVPTDELQELASLRECLRYSSCDKAVCRQIQAVGSLQCCSFMTPFFRLRTWTCGRSGVGYTRWRHRNSCSAPLRFWLIVHNAPAFI